MNHSQIQRDTVKAFKQMGEMGLLTTITYTQLTGEPVYDTTLREEVVTSHTFDMRAVISEYKRIEISNDVRLTDSRAIVLRNLFKIPPTIDDIVEFNNKDHHVISIIDLPQRPTIELQLRAA